MFREFVCREAIEELNVMIKASDQIILILSNTSEVIRAILSVLARRGVRGSVVSTVKEASDHLSRCAWDLVIVDLDLAGQAADELLHQARDRRAELPAIAIGRSDSAAAGVRAIRAGWTDYLVSVPSVDDIESMLETLMPSHEFAVAEGDSLGEHGYRIAGESQPLLETVRLARRVAPTSAPVLLSGESGTGKELVANLIHQASRRGQGPFVKVNCAALSESLLESELFGHERGAFTGANHQRAGCFERAHGGTLLLDEISETAPRLQAQLLRVLEQQDFQRVGGSESIRVNVRVIGTSNRDLAKEIEHGRFRADLFYRLSGVHLTIPPLRQRLEDIPQLVWHFINLYAPETQRCVTKLEPELLLAFSRHSWPGNIRQLRNVVRSGLILGQGDCLTLLDCQTALQQTPGGAVASSMSLRLEELERKAIFEALRRTKSHQAKAARLLGITDRTLREKLRRYREENDLQPA